MRDSSDELKRENQKAKKNVPSTIMGESVSRGSRKMEEFISRQTPNIRGLLLLNRLNMEEIQTFVTNPTFLQGVGPQNYDDFGFSFETNEDGSFKSASYKGQILDPNIGAGVFLMRGELIKAHRKERDQYKKKIKAVEEREMYKSEMINCMNKNKRQKADNHYQERTCALYRKILERFVDLPNDTITS